MVLKGDRDIVIERVFRAPPRVVFDAWTRAELVRRWWAPKSHGVEMVECTADVRVGGKYRYVLGRGGERMAFSGEYQEIAAPSRLVYTQVFEAMPGPPAVITVTFSAAGEATKMVSEERYPSAEVREVVIASGMEGGMRETMDQLDDLVLTLL